MPIEQNDPCVRAAELRAIRDDIVLGKQVTETEFEAGNGTRRRVKFNSANLQTLNKMIAEAENACAIQQGQAPKRFAIVPR